MKSSEQVKKLLALGTKSSCRHIIWKKHPNMNPKRGNCQIASIPNAHSSTERDHGKDTLQTGC